jgi:HlyD family secretion protein
MYFSTDKLNEAKVAIGVALTKMNEDSLLLSRQRSLWSQGIGSRVDFEQRQHLLPCRQSSIQTCRLKQTLSFNLKKKQ